MPTTSNTHRSIAFADRRRSAGLTQARLAGLAECSRATVALIEGGYVPQRSEVIPRIEAVLDRTLRSLNDEDRAANPAFGKTSDDALDEQG